MTLTASATPKSSPGWLRGQGTLARSATWCTQGDVRHTHNTVVPVLLHVLPINSRLINLRSVLFVGSYHTTTNKKGPRSSFLGQARFFFVRQGLVLHQPQCAQTVFFLVFRAKMSRQKQNPNFLRRYSRVHYTVKTTFIYRLRIQHTWFSQMPTRLAPKTGVYAVANGLLNLFAV